MELSRPDRYRDETYLLANPSWHEEDSTWKAGRVAELLRSNEMTPSSICDVGCGVAGVLDVLATEFPAAVLTGYDVSPHAVRVANERRPEIDVRLGDLNDSTESYEVVLLLDVIEHVEDYFQLLRSIRDRGRYIVLHIPLDMTVQGVLRMKPLLRSRLLVGHLHYFSKETALASLEDCGYKIVAVELTKAGIEAPHRTLRQRLAAVPRALMFRISPVLASRVLGGFSLLVIASEADHP